MGDKFRQRSAKSVFDEIKYLYETYGVSYFKVEDDNITLNRQRIIDLCKMIISSGIKVYFDARNGVSIKTLDSEVVDLMRRAGFIMVSLAVESGSDYIRNEIMGKRIGREQIINAFKMCRAVGINTNAFFIVGMPEETEETLEETIALLNEIDTTRVSIHVAKPLPGTKLFEQCQHDRILNYEYDINSLWTGDAELNALSKEEFYIKQLMENSVRHFWIKPYKLSMDKLMKMDVDIQKLAYEKTKLWVEHMRRNNS